MQKVVACLLCLLHEGLPKELPGDVLYNAARLLQALVDGNRPHLQSKLSTPCNYKVSCPRYSDILASLPSES